MRKIWVLTAEIVENKKWQKVWYAGRYRINDKLDSPPIYAPIWSNTLNHKVKKYERIGSIERIKQWLENENSSERLQALKIERISEPEKVLRNSGYFTRNYHRGSDDRNYPVGQEIVLNYPIGAATEIFYPDSRSKVRATIIDYFSYPNQIIEGIVVRLVEDPTVQLTIFCTYLNKDGSGTHLLTGFEDD